MLDDVTMPARSLSNTPFGPLTIHQNGEMITRVTWDDGSDDETPLLTEALGQLADYIAGRRQTFDLPLAVSGSGFQRAVCHEIQKIPFGDTNTYGEIAKALGASAQAVGSACGANPIPVIIPCHRVLGATGLTGFSGRGGVETKVALLRHEGAGGFLI